ncbi:MAG: recombinase family protein [bacterium]|nr:recombinase family protein [bacterium]
MDTNKKAVIYCRVSTDEQANKGISLDVQEKICIEDAAKNGYSIVEVIKDEGKSGTSLNRSGIQRVFNLTRENKITAVFMIHGDRLARNTEDHLTAKRLFKSNGVKVFFVYQPGLDSDTAMGTTMDTVLAAFNAHQSMVISEKTKSSLIEKAKEGWFPGQALIGYKNVDNPKFRQGEISKRIIIQDEAMAPLIKETFNLYSTGNYNGFELNEMMYEKGLRTKRGKKIHPSIFYDILSNPLYIGELHWGEIHLKEARHTPIIDRATFDRVQSVLAAHNHYATRKRKHSFLLRGLIRCKEHLKRYTAEFHKKKSGSRFSYYHCPNRSGCNGSNVRTEFLEDEVKLLFKDLEFSNTLTDKIISKAKAKFEIHRKEYEKQIKTLNSQKSSLCSKRKIAEDKLFKEVITDNDFTRIRKEIDTEINIIDSQTDKLESQREIKIDIAQEVLRFTRNIYDAYNKANLIIKRHYLLLFFKEIYVYKGEVREVIHSELFEKLLELKQLMVRKPTETMAPIIISGNLGGIPGSDRC